MEGNGPKWRPVVRGGCKGETALRRSEEWEPWDGSDLTCVSGGLSPFFKPLCFPTKLLYVDMS